MLLEGGLDWKPMGSRPTDMEFHRAKEAAARDVALAFGVPPMLLGLPGDNTYANYSEAHRAFYRLTVLPLVAKTLAALVGVAAGLLWRAVPGEGRLRQRAGARPRNARRCGGGGAAAEFLSDAEKRQLLGLPKVQEE